MNIRQGNMEQDQTMPNGPILLFDGVCGFCNQSVQTILTHDTRGTMRFAALQSEFGQTVLARHPELKAIDSVVLVEPASDAQSERVYIRSTAALRVAAYLGGMWKLCLVAYCIPRPIRDFFYNLFAKHRYTFFGKYESCMIPSPEVRSRFL